MTVSCGICAYNEASNIGNLLARLHQEPLISEVIVVASGCTDDTVKIACQYNKTKVLVQSTREGKASAVNLFLKEARGNILILISADTIPISFAIRNLLAPFQNPAVGIVGGHPIPADSHKTVTGYANHLIWSILHHVALGKPKSGEIIAFRNVVREIPVSTAVDESEIERMVIEQGYYQAYAPKAIVINKGAGTLRELYKQRKRIAYGHLSLAKKGYKVSTLPTGNVIRALPAVIRENGFSPGKMAIAGGIELWARLQAKRELAKNSNKYQVWEALKTTKEVYADK